MCSAAKGQYYTWLPSGAENLAEDMNSDLTSWNLPHAPAVGEEAKLSLWAFLEQKGR